MAYVDTDEHSLEAVHDLGELHGKEVTTAFGVHLADNVRSFGRVESSSISRGNHLRRHTVLVKCEFVHGIVAFHA